MPIGRSDGKSVVLFADGHTRTWHAQSGTMNRGWGNTQTDTDPQQTYFWW